MVSPMFPTRKKVWAQWVRTDGALLGSIITNTLDTIFIFAISLRGVVVAKIPVIVVCTAPGVPNGALGGVSGGCKGDVEGSGEGINRAEEEEGG